MNCIACLLVVTVVMVARLLLACQILRQLELLTDRKIIGVQDLKNRKSCPSDARLRHLSIDQIALGIYNMAPQVENS